MAHERPPSRNSAPSSKPTSRPSTRTSSRGARRQERVLGFTPADSKGQFSWVLKSAFGVLSRSSRIALVRAFFGVQL